MNKKVIVFLLLGAYAMSLFAQEESEKWEFVVAPYFYLASQKGSMSANKNMVLPIDVNFLEVAENVNFAMQGHFEAKKGKWGFGIDGVYMDAAMDVKSDIPQIQMLNLSADITQFTGEVFGFYRAAEGWGTEGNTGFADVMLGARYFNLETQMVGHPLNNEKNEIDFLDLMIGLRAFQPVAGNFGVLARMDVSFLGSDYVWNNIAHLSYRINSHWIPSIGYRYYRVKYEEEENGFVKLYDTEFYGPMIALQFRW